ncbi:hypothetical protein C8A03DRAFT_38923 [Achaetomium macrosporum]|uniref:NAD(P)-binding domain-containing protein n=1 Tax=Achaetomium macrosporum TaxID=79813 RepID=A0AAN7H6T7_9PEZI|nr:hypothetical protein C8A03DRAFT_38923 [Achaetomium macrosporum]
MTTKTYALLGATGATGSSVLRSFLRSPPLPSYLQLNVLVHSKTKLLQAFPHLLTGITKTIEIRIFEGGTTSADALVPCLASSSTIIICIGQNGSPPGTSLQSDTATAVRA